ncbi:MAG TPA: STAS domain-containing protein [Clostridia bacterium]|nr:STAS domain-containing protein [Clostridia bacterium]
METSRPVVVKRMPERLNMKNARAVLEEVKPFLESDRPQIVFDLSQVKHIDAAGVDLLLHCMAETAKRDGDLKLSSLSPQAAVVLELTRTDRLFEIYEAAADAVRSFSSFLPNAVRQFYPSHHFDSALSFPNTSARKDKKQRKETKGDSEAAA